MDNKSKIIGIILSILASALASFMGNTAAGKASNDPQVIREAIQEGIKAGLVESEKAKAQVVKYQSMRAPFQMPTDATATVK